MPALAQLPPGTTLGGDFEVVRPLAQGGMGAVYVARQRSTGYERALKVMHPQLVPDGRSCERFLQEAQASSRIESDHVVQIIAAGIDPTLGVPWLAMELLRGADLAALLRQRGRLAPGEVLEVFRQLCHGLGAAHRAGLVHRDLKPENVFVAEPRREGTAFMVKVLDFGIAKALGAGVNPTTSAIGSPLWMAPEQTETGRVVPATDVWALGLLAFHLLTGRYYWLAASAGESTLAQLMRELYVDAIEPASQRAARYGCAPAIPQGFDAWFSRCMEREPSQRFRDASEALSSLAQVLTGRDLTPAPLSSRDAATVMPTLALPAFTPPPVAPPSPSPFVAPTPVVVPSVATLRAAGQPPAPGPAALPPTAYTPALPPTNQFAVSSSAWSSGPGITPAPPPPWVPTPPPVNVHPAFTPSPITPSAPGRRSFAGLMAGLFVLTGLVAVGGFYALGYFFDEPEGPTTDAGTRPRPDPRPPPPDPRPTPRDAGQPGPPSAPPVEPTTLASGFAHTCALGDGGSVRCWGANAFGQLGDGTTQDRAVPTPVPGLTGAVSIAAGYAHTCALTGDGAVHCWGLNSSGQLGDGRQTPPRSSPWTVRGLQGVTQLALGEGHSCALRSDGSVRCWGSNQRGQLGDGLTIDHPLPAPVRGLAGVRSLAAGDVFTCASLSDGLASCWGANDFAQLGLDVDPDPRPLPARVPGLASIAVVVAAPFRACARVTDGTVRCWGRNDASQSIEGPAVLRGPNALPGLAGVARLALGPFHTCAAFVDGAARCWGGGSEGQLGDGAPTAVRATPTPVQGLAGVRELALGERHSCARVASGAVWCWGANDHGQLGDGGDQGSPTPRAVRW